MPKAKLAKINFILLFCLLSLAWVQSFTPLQTVLASEEENIDSFNVHPSTRWSTYVSSGITTSVSDGILNITDTGDQTDDRYNIYRGLRKLDGTIEIKFKTHNLGPNGDDWKDRFGFWLASETTGSDDAYMGFYGYKWRNDSYALSTVLHYEHTGEASSAKTLTGDERIYDDTWYILKINYNLLESITRLRLYFSDNNSKVFDYYWQDISSTYFPKLFQYDVVNFHVEFRCYTNLTKRELLIDYVNAPFKEREWTLYSGTSDTDWLDYSPTIARCQGAVTEDIAYRVDVPYLDFFSGSFTMHWENASGINSGDSFGFEVRVYGVDADDGDLHYIIGFEGQTGRYGASQWSNFVYLQNGTDNTYYKSESVSSGTSLTDMGADFCFELKEDRDEITLKVRFYNDISDKDNYYDLIEAESVSDYVSSLSDEFVIEIEYDPDITASGEMFYMNINDLGFVARNIFTDIGNAIGKFISGFLEFIFIEIGRFIAGIFKFVGDLIIGAVDALQPFLTAIETAVGNVTTAIGDVIGELQGLAADIANEVWTGIDSTLSFIQDWINDVWSAFTSAAGDFIDACITALGTLISDFVGWCIDCVFWLWDQLSLPDLLAIIDTLLTGFIQLATNLPATLLQFITALQAIWMLVIYLGVIFFFLIPCLSAPSVGEWIEKVIQAMGFDITLGLQVLGTGMRIPAVLPWMVCIIYYVLTDVIFGGFF